MVRCRCVLTRCTLTGVCIELTQEVASRSISIVYDLSSEYERQNMLKALFDTLMNGKKYIFFLVGWW